MIEKFLFVFRHKSLDFNPSASIFHVKHPTFGLEFSTSFFRALSEGLVAMLEWRSKEFVCEISSFGFLHALNKMIENPLNSVAGKLLKLVFRGNAGKLQ